MEENARFSANKPTRPHEWFLNVRRTEVLRQKRFAHGRLLLLVEAMRGAAGLAAVGALGALLGEWLLAETVQLTARLAAAFKIGAGSVIVVGLTFAVLGARGCVVFADLVGDFGERKRKRPTAGAALEECAVEFVGGATWGTVCGALLGVTAAAGCWLAGVKPIGLPASLATGAGSGAFLGLVLAALGMMARAIRRAELAEGDFGPFPFIGYFCFHRTVPECTESVGGEVVRMGSEAQKKTPRSEPAVSPTHRRNRNAGLH